MEISDVVALRPALRDELLAFAAVLPRNDAYRSGRTCGSINQRPIGAEALS
jgi:hypothetical protein